MIAIPAVDLREGACVQLVGGSYADERIRIADPVAAGRHWTGMGFRRLHVVDLDAATGRDNKRNLRAVGGLLAFSGVEVQVGGGIRTAERITALLESGASCVVVGTRALDDPGWLAGVVAVHPDRVIVAADVRERRIVTHGWARDRAIDVTEFLRGLEGLSLAGILVTAVHREGLRAGTDIALIEEATESTKIPLIASGGIASIEELRTLDRIGVSAAVLGMSLYTGALEARAVAEEFA